MRNPFQLDPSCERCPALVASRRQVVHGYGASNAEIFFVGRSPGHGGSDDTGVPFTGDAAGRRFLGVLQRVGLCEDDDRSSTEPRLACFVINAVRCATPGNRPPRVTELRSCSGWLAEEILRVDPAVIVPVGSAAGHAIYDLVVREPFPGVRVAHGTALTRHGYGVHPFSHLVRMRTDELRSVTSRLVRVAVHARPSPRSAKRRLDRAFVERTLFRVGLASRLAADRAAAAAGSHGGQAFWTARMEEFARLALASFRHVHGEEGTRPRFRYLGEREGEVYLQPLDAGPKGPRDLHEALRFDASPRGVLEYWLVHRHLWNVAETRRYELVFHEGRLQRLLEEIGERPTRKVVDRRLVFPPSVRIEAGTADLTILARDRREDRLVLRLATVRIGLDTGHLRYVDRRDHRF